jgi:hypothetical protein
MSLGNCVHFRTALFGHQPGLMYIRSTVAAALLLESITARQEFHPLFNWDSICPQ